MLMYELGKTAEQNHADIVDLGIDGFIRPYSISMLDPTKSHEFLKIDKSFQCADFRDNFSLANELREMCGRVIDSFIKFACCKLLRILR